MDIDRDDIRRLLDCLDFGNYKIMIADPEDIIRGMCEELLDRPEESEVVVDLREVYQLLPEGDELDEMLDMLDDGTDRKLVKETLSELPDKFKRAWKHATEILKGYENG